VIFPLLLFVFYCSTNSGTTWRPELPGGECRCCS